MGSMQVHERSPRIVLTFIVCIDQPEFFLIPTSEGVEITHIDYAIVRNVKGRLRPPVP